MEAHGAHVLSPAGSSFRRGNEASVPRPRPAEPGSIWTTVKACRGHPAPAVPADLTVLRLLRRTWNMLCFFTNSKFEAGQSAPFFQQHLLTSHFCVCFGGSHKDLKLFYYYFIVMVPVVSVYDSLKGQTMASVF